MAHCDYIHCSICDIKAIYEGYNNQCQLPVVVMCEDCAKKQKAKNDQVRAALVGLVGVDGKHELEEMEAVMRMAQAPATDKAVSINAVHALLATLP